ncbi:MAG: elongation factor P--(R)-beta-lysine ligase [Spirochaetes bacterium]|nr:MAG: elongation factor P--(R)-beta-lysine ligase [Spirochaetota bacterium]RKX98232.1 MAG: elongation factor P--(R)-beta-lysine ligase [Spirochaetota bacterium]
MQFKPEAIIERAAMYRGIRDYFDNCGYLEVDTPLLTDSPIPESHIELFQTRKVRPDGTSYPLYLVPSPEIWLKMALASGSSSLFQIGRCFRNGEQMDKWHRNEFTMLEWYGVDKTSGDNLLVMQEIIKVTLHAVNSEAGEEVSGNIREISMDEAFREFAGFSLESALEESGLSGINRTSPGYPASLADISEFFRSRLKEKNLPSGDIDRESADDLFHRLFLTLVEDALPADRPLALTHWPAFIPTLARGIPDTPWADRWELYIRGVEVANCYGEETDEELLKNYWENESPEKPDPDFRWPQLIGRGMPSCSGTAVGLDRLLALVRGDDSLKGLDLFPIHDNMPR